MSYVNTAVFTYWRIYESCVFYYVVPHVCVCHIVENVTVIRYGVYNSHVFSHRCQQVDSAAMSIYVYIWHIYHIWILLCWRVDSAAMSIYVYIWHIYHIWILLCCIWHIYRHSRTRQHVNTAVVIYEYCCVDVLTYVRLIHSTAWSHMCVRVILWMSLWYGAYNSHVFSHECHNDHFTVVFMSLCTWHIHIIYCCVCICHILVNTTVSTRDIHQSHVFYCMVPHMYSRMTHRIFSHPTQPQEAPSNVA